MSMGMHISPFVGMGKRMVMIAWEMGILLYLKIPVYLVINVKKTSVEV